nr:hypothetical protein HmN_000147400 [Hymenolepis microstoma]
MIEHYDQVLAVRQWEYWPKRLQSSKRNRINAWKSGQPTNFDEEEEEEEVLKSLIKSDTRLTMEARIYMLNWAIGLGAHE